MNINGIGVSNYYAARDKKKTQYGLPKTSFAEHMDTANPSDTDLRASCKGPGRIPQAAEASGRDHCLPTIQEPEVTLDAEQKRDKTEQDTETKSEIIVKPDGSRVLMITVNIGGMETAMSLQISEPTRLQNDISRQENDAEDSSFREPSINRVC